MTIDVVDLLSEAGEAMERDSAAAVAERVVSMERDGARPPAGDHHARGVRAAWLAAAAVLVVAMAVLAVVSLRSDVPVAPVDSSAPVILVPGDLGAWDQVAVTDMDDAWLGNIELVVLVPEGDPQSRRRAVSVVRGESLDSSGVRYREVEGAGLTGRLVDSTPGHRLLINLPGGEGMLSLVSGDEVTVDELFELAAALDLSRPLLGQDPPSGWQVHTTAADHTEATIRGLTLYRGGDSGAELLWVTMVSNVDETAMWLFGEPGDVIDGEVRGRPAWFTSAGGVTVKWMETDDALIIVRYRPPSFFELDDEAGLALAIALVEELVAIDDEEWAALVERTAEQRGLDLDRLGETILPTEPPPEGEYHGSNRSGEFRLFVDDDADVACVALPIDAVPECDGPERARGTPGGSVPKVALTYDSEPELIYGFLPAGAASAFATWEIEVADDEPHRYELPAMALDDLWYLDPPGDQHLLHITYRDASGEVIDTFEPHEFE